MNLSDAPSREDQRVRFTITAFAGVMLILILLSIQLSMLQVPSATLVYGSPEVWRGEHAGFRVLSVHPERIRPFVMDSVRVALVDEAGVRSEMSRRRTPLGQFVLAIPKDLGPKPTLHVEVTLDGDKESFYVPLSPVNTPNIMGGTVHHNADNLEKMVFKKGPNSVDIYPSTHRVTSALPNTLTARVLRGGRPVPGPVSIEELDLETTANAQGLFTFEYTPRPRKDAMKVLLGETRSMQADLALRPHPVQLLLQTDHSVMTEGYKSLDYTVHSLPYNRPIHIDTWVGKSLVNMTSTIAIGGIHRGEINFTHAPVPTTAVVFRNIIAPDANASWRTFWPGTLENESHRLTLASWLKSQPGGDTLMQLSHEELAATPKLLELLMARFKPETVSAQLMHSNREARQAHFDRYRVGLRGHINRIFAVTLILGMILATLWVVRHKQGVRAAMRAVAQGAIDEGEDLDPSELEKVTRNQYAFDLLMVVFFLFLFGYGLYILLARYMNWGW